MDKTEAKGLKKEMVEIPVPFTTVKNAYGRNLADILERLKDSVAAEAKKHMPEEFKYFFTYAPTTDPSTSDEQEFVKEITASTKVSLYCRGFSFKTSSPLDAIPEVVLHRFQERARLICGSRNRQAEKPVEVPVVKEAVQFNEEVVALQHQIDELLSRMVVTTLDVGYLQLAKSALAMYNRKNT